MAAQPFHLGWDQPVDLRFGPGCLSALEADRPFLVLADRTALSYEAESALVEQLGANSLHWLWTHPEPATVSHAHSLCEEAWPALRHHPECGVLAIGGGTTLDLAKVVRYTFDSCIRTDLEGCWRTNTVPVNAHRHVLWAVPTTAGTGSEVTPWATLWDPEGSGKLSWAPDAGFADHAWIDPILTLSCPARITRDCALDALSHALESIWNHHTNAGITALAVEAAQSIWQHLPVALKQPDDLDARTALARASLAAGLAMAQTHTALAHALSYDLTLNEGLPHGEACAVWLPMAWELASGKTADCDAALANITGLPAMPGAQALRIWLNDLGIQTRDLRHEGAGLHTLTKEMRSVRGRNFIAA